MSEPTRVRIFIDHEGTTVDMTAWIQPDEDGHIHTQTVARRLGEVAASAVRALAGSYCEPDVKALQSGTGVWRP